MLLALLPFYFVSFGQNMSTFLRYIISASSLPPPVIVPIFKVPTFMSERLPFHASRCLFTRLPPLFLLFFSLAVAKFPQVPCCATPEAVVGNPGRDRFGMDLSTIRICIIWQKSFPRMPFLPQPSPFIWAWNWHQDTQECASDVLVKILIVPTFKNLFRNF